MHRPTFLATRLLTVLALLCAPAHAEEAESLKDALAKGTPLINLRYRYELVDDDGFDKDAHASTLRTTLGYRTLPYKGLSFFIQAQNVAPLFGDGTYNNKGFGHLANDATDRPPVVDPAQTRMQQVYLRLDAFDTMVDFGRREIIYGDHRFIGNVAWRQNHQAFDAVHLVSKAVGKTTLSYTFADKVLRITGEEKEMSSHFLNGVVKLRDAVSLELFGYLLDYEAPRDFGLSSQTYGFRLHGSEPLNDTFRLHFEAEYAEQKDYGENPAELDASYVDLMAGIGYGKVVNVKLGRERLGAADGPLAFQTPLATGHKFNGWADKFLKTPKDGLVDWYLSADGRIRNVSWLVVYHDFGADRGDASYGTELNAQVSVPTSWKQLFAAKLALYREDGFSTDTSKFWFWTQYSF